MRVNDAHPCRRAEESDQINKVSENLSSGFLDIEEGQEAERSAE
jgi:hypothetical protein